MAENRTKRGERFTPGPWKRERSGRGRVTVRQRANQFGFEKLIATVAEPTGVVRTEEEVEANAALIAAAPALYDACQEAFAYLRGTYLYDLAHKVRHAILLADGTVTE